MIEVSKIMSASLKSQGKISPIKLSWFFLMHFFLFLCMLNCSKFTRAILLLGPDYLPLISYPNYMLIGIQFSWLGRFYSEVHTFTQKLSTKKKGKGNKLWFWSHIKYRRTPGFLEVSSPYNCRKKILKNVNSHCSKSIKHQNTLKIVFISDKY